MEVLGVAPQTRLTFFHCKKDPAGRFCKKASTPSRRPQDKPILSRAFYNLFYQGLHPLPALLFSLQKSKQKASTPGSHKIYFYPGILQLPTVGQVKCLYNSVKNKFYRRLQRGALNGKQQRQTANDKGNQQQKTKGKKHKNTYCLIGRLGGER